MAKDPAVLFYTQDFLQGTSLFTATQRGHYITLLCNQQQSKTGSLKIEIIRALMGKDFEKHWPVIAEKFGEDENGFFNERMRFEVNRRRSYSESRSKNRKKDMIDISASYDNHMETAIEIRNKNVLESEKISLIANEVWKDQKWRENISMGLGLKNEGDLKKWMAQYNASLAGDSIQGFNAKKYMKMFRGWLNVQQSKGYQLQESEPPKSNGISKLLKNINHMI